MFDHFLTLGRKGLPYPSTNYFLYQSLKNLKINVE